jgi:hypothetical protein
MIELFLATLPTYLAKMERLEISVAPDDPTKPISLPGSSSLVTQSPCRFSQRLASEPSLSNKILSQNNRNML